MYQNTRCHKSEDQNTHLHSREKFNQSNISDICTTVYILTVLKICFLSRCSHTWERAPVLEHRSRADFTQFLNQDGR
jgi:hypothetical protein